MGTWELEFGGDGPESIGGLLKTVVDHDMAQRMSAGQRAAVAWRRANGDRERAHTTGVFLKRPRLKNAAPILGVYVDSHALVTDFSANKDIYLARLANIGFEVSGIEFLPSRRGHAARRGMQERSEAKVPRADVTLSAQELEEVADLVSELPDALRESASKAVVLMKLREKQQNTENT